MYEDIKQWGSLLQESINKDIEYKKQVKAYEAEKAVMDSAEDIELDEAETTIDWTSEDAKSSSDPYGNLKKELDIVAKKYGVNLDIVTMDGLFGWPLVKVSGDQFNFDKFLDAYEVGFPEDILNQIDSLYIANTKPVINVKLLSSAAKDKILNTIIAIANDGINSDVDTEEFFTNIMRVLEKNKLI